MKSSFINIEIPKEWQVKRIKDVCIINSENLNLDKLNDFDEICYIDISSIDTQNYRIQKYQKIPKSTLPSRARRITKKNNIIISTVRPYLKATAKIEAKHDYFVCSTGFAVLEAKNQIDHDFLFQWVLGEKFVNYLISNMVGSNYPAVNTKDIEDGPVILPPYSEQQIISSILSNVDSIIHQTQQLINNLQLLKKGLMQQLFSQGIGHKEFQDTKQGRIPKEWEVVKLEQLIEVKSGKRLPKGEKFSKIQTSYPYIRVLDFKDGTINLNNLEYLTPQLKKILNKYTISSEDVYISIAGSIGIVGLVPNELNNANLTENAANLSIKEKKKLTKEFLYYYLDSSIGQKEIRLRKTITTLPKLAFKRIEKIPIVLPSIHEQKQLTSFLINLDRIIEEEIVNLNELMKIKQGLMQNLLTGKKRVPISLT